ncbi:MAG: putative Thiosulfate sulfertransferase [Verrucomicrobiaceae bacterium]|nr:putative Thiosulfate sulfertransferase [Verrucomicrobiaceae bacterium]
MSKQTLSVHELATCYRDSNVVVIDCRFALSDTELGTRQFAQAHIPGAHYLHLDRDLSGPKNIHGGRHPLPDIKIFAATLSAIGVNSEPPTLVVAYDDSRFGFAARVWWLLRYCGHDNVKVLDGGFTAWQAGGFPVADELTIKQSTPPRRGNFIAQLRHDLIVDIEAVKTLHEKPDAVLIDSREERRYLGLEEPIDPVAGHIPGAKNFPWQSASNEFGQLRPQAEQRQRLAGIAAKKEIVVYCGSGVTACVNLLALSEIGRDDAKLYPGSWSDWCSWQ